ncbi:Dinitrogenase iron-molybdenum cofactor biosynthesis [Thermoproteus uzoniensis 768-20]|uniref:Dinitrogenase iron-molybdenum cofactor biosynthesis n=1 Tax=Thermoproteus uzoniensis (strain 768-20) TaxID=999630 RepID=F2L089_THEU7|nr:dinitrogenase iron-molybdenum cofactor biosynthesis protein [Thermoproteus uzoniensis]AEA12571.1 Dinitrogenase iron-molybdenum cofactor biosynthesis [Thermoproteus uzoniensis 768-20]
MELKIAIAAAPEGVVFPGHFAHAPIYKIYKYKDGALSPIEERRNPLGSVPDADAGHGISAMNSHFQGESPSGNIPMHGLAKYKWLRERVLPDVDVVIAGGACQTSYRYFTSEGVKILFTDPVEIEALVNYVSANPKDFEEALEQAGNA